MPFKYLLKYKISFILKYKTDSYHIGQCQHNTHFDWSKEYIAEYGIVCPLCVNGFNDIKDTKEGKQKLCEMIFAMQKKLHPILFCCSSIQSISE